ncbi:acetylornithine transaminase [Longispora albida]|uniref:acetylornithine transaminase n=1 Tax=Longispora albida TaxID=203523 RepID=UPI000377AAFD|nr:acetylornithine transaminase [Longispora albida]
MSLVERFGAAIMPTYGGPAIGLVSGRGAEVTDEAGKTYVDFLGGIAVNALGHAHPAIVEAVSRQIATLGHVSNLYAHPTAVELAEKLVALTGRAGKVYFCNSGAEASEAAFKLSRRTGRTGIVAAQGAFHGRTMGALALTGQPSKQDPFKPLPGDVTHVPYGSVAALEAAVDETTAMVILEPIQGENGVLVAPPGYLAAAREITARHGALLVLDEVQTGIGRTGHWFACQAEGVAPDAITLAKGLGGGLPIGALVVFGDAAELIQPGGHGSTFGGNPVSCAAGLAVIRTIEAEGLLGHVKAMGERLRGGLPGDLHGAGLLLGVPVADSAAVAADLLGKGFLVNAVQPGTIRLAPPLNITESQVDALIQAWPA